MGLVVVKERKFFGLIQGEIFTLGDNNCYLYLSSPLEVFLI